MVAQNIIAFFADYIKNNTGIVYNDVTFFQLENRLNVIVQQLGLGSIEKFYDSVKVAGIRGFAADLLLDLATNNETSFFRDPRVFTSIADHIIPEILARKKSGEMFRIWCAASSTGQEPYSIAMIFDEIKKKGVPIYYEIIASDFSERVLNRCREGKYTQLEAQRGLAATRLVNYFEQVEDKGDGLIWQINAELRNHITWRKINLVEPFPVGLGNFDIIFCRNVLIYQSVENKKKIINQMKANMVPDGYFVFGGTESMVGLSEDFSQETKGGAIFYKIKANPNPLSKAV